MNDKEKGVWFSFVVVMENFPGNKKVHNYETLVTNFLSVFHDQGCNMNVKFDFLYIHLDRFPENFGTVSDEQREHFHQDLKTKEENYQRRWNKYDGKTTTGTLNKIVLRKSTDERDSSTNSWLTKLCIFIATHFLTYNAFHINSILCIDEQIERQIKCVYVTFFFISPANWMKVQSHASSDRRRW